MQAWKKKLEGSVRGEGECGDEVEVLLVREMKFGNFVSEVSEDVSERRAWGRGR